MGESVRGGDVPNRFGEEGPTHVGAQVLTTPASRRAHLICIAGGEVGRPFLLEAHTTELGRAETSDIYVDNVGVSRVHARVVRKDDTTFLVEDLGSANGTLLNGQPMARGEQAVLREGDKIQVGTMSLFRFSFLDAVEEQYQSRVWQAVEAIASAPASQRARNWSPDSWQEKKIQQNVTYESTALLDSTLHKLRRLPPLVTSFEIEDLKRRLAEAQEGERFVLQGGDCAETFAECEPTNITNKLKILIQMSLVLTKATRRPVIRIGRFAGQYAKPRSKSTETRDGVEVPSYFGDMVNDAPFDSVGRRPDPTRLLSAYQHAAMTLNFIRALTSGGLSDLRRAEYFDLDFRHADLTATLAADYRRIAREISQGFQFVHAAGERSVDELMRLDFFSSHEGLSLHYESAQTRTVPRRDGFYDLTTHMPWIGERTRALDGAHVEFFRGLSNPIGLKVGPSADPEEIVETCRALNPENERGKIVLITRLGAKTVEAKLPGLIRAITRSRRRVLWVSDPMHGNGTTTAKGIKTRRFTDILAEVEGAMRVHAAEGSRLGGVHFELTGDDVTECIRDDADEGDLEHRYETLCDPRLNYRQAIEMAFAIGRHLETASPSVLPPPINKY